MTDPGSEAAHEGDCPKGLLRCAKLGQGRSLITVGQIARASSSKAARTRRFYCFLGPEFVVAAAEVPDEGMPGADHLCAAELLEAARRPES